MLGSMLRSRPGSWPRTLAEHGLDVDGAVSVRVLSQHASARCLADRSRAVRCEARHVLRDLCAVAGDEHLALGLEELVEPDPRVRDQAGARAGRLEHARRGREPVRGHRLAAHVEDRERARVERVVVARVHVADVADVRWGALVGPPGAAEEERVFGE
jgi:hypothetical protein